MQTRLRALLEPAINKKRESNKSKHHAYRYKVREYEQKMNKNKENKGVFVFGSSFSGLSVRVLGFGSSFSCLGS